jgi:hypothetical protein
VAIEFRLGSVTAVAALLLSLAACSVSVDRSGDDAREQTSQVPPGGAAGREFVPGPDNEDPSKDIEGVEITEYDAVHAEPGQRVRYEKAPPDGGRHDQVWAACNGVVYDTPVRNEHMVHALEHGAVWIAYNADEVTGDDLQSLEDRVDGQPYLMLSPYPGLDQPISLQAWGHQLKLSDAGDERIDQFIAALRDNEYTTPEPPEPGAPCDQSSADFDQNNPPPFEAEAPGPDAAPVGDN